MKRIMVILLAAGLIVVVACGKKETKPEQPVAPQAKTTEVQKAPQEDTSFENVMKVLRESLEREKRDSSSTAKIQTAKAYLLLIKFLQTDKEKVKKAGMTEADVSFLVTDAKAKAKQRLEEVIKNPTAPPATKQEAETLFKSL